MNEHLLRMFKSHWIVDGLTAISIVEPETILKSYKCHGYVEICKGISYGMLVLRKEEAHEFMVKHMKDNFHVDISKNNVEIIDEMDPDKVVDVLANALASLGEKGDKKTG